MLGPDKLLIAGIASPQNYILYEDTTNKFLMPQLLRIKSNVPVTMQRYNNINYIVAAGPISKGKGAILVTSSCDNGATDLVPTVKITSTGNATVVTVKLSVPEGGALEMPFLNRHPTRWSSTRICTYSTSPRTSSPRIPLSSTFHARQKQSAGRQVWSGTFSLSKLGSMQRVAACTRTTRPIGAPLAILPKELLPAFNSAYGAKKFTTTMMLLLT